MFRKKDKDKVKFDSKGKDKDKVKFDSEAIKNKEMTAVKPPESVESPRGIKALIQNDEKEGLEEAKAFSGKSKMISRNKATLFPEAHAGAPLQTGEKKAISSNKINKR